MLIKNHFKFFSVFFCQKVTNLSKKKKYPFCLEQRKSRKFTTIKYKRTLVRYKNMDTLPIQI